MFYFISTVLLEFERCQHPTVMKDMCAECGMDLRETLDRNQTAAVAIVHNIPELMVSMEVGSSWLTFYTQYVFM